MYKHKSTSSSYIVFLIFIIIICVFIRSCASDTIYNNGICTYCGGHYIYSQAVGHRHTTNYIYICDKCGHTIEVSQHYREGNNEIITG